MKKRLRIHRLSFVAVAILLSAGLTWAVKPTDHPLQDFDAAGGFRLGLHPGSTPSPAQQAALRRLEQEAGAKLRLNYNRLSRAPRTLTAGLPLSPPSAADPETIGRDGEHPLRPRPARRRRPCSDRHAEPDDRFLSRPADPTHPDNSDGTISPSDSARPLRCRPEAGRCASTSATASPR